MTNERHINYEEIQNFSSIGYFKHYACYAKTHIYMFAEYHFWQMYYDFTKCRFFSMLIANLVRLNITKMSQK